MSRGNFKSFYFCLIFIGLTALDYYHSLSCFFAKIFLPSNRLIVSRLMSYCLPSQLTSHVSRLTSSHQQEGAMASPSRGLT